MSLHHMLRAAAGSAGPSDPYFEYNTLLLTGNGTNGAQNNTFIDSSTNNFTITRNGNTTQGTFSPYGNLWSNYFDGNGDYLSVPHSNAFEFGNGDFTIEFWANTQSFQSQTYTPICGVWSANPTSSDTNSSWYVSINAFNTTYKLGFSYRTTGSNVDIALGTATNGTGTWDHYAIVRSGNTLYGFKNGTMLNTGGTSFTPTLLTGGTTPLLVGTIVGGNTYNGHISNFRIVKGTALYTSNFTPSTTPLTAVSGTSLLTCQSNRFVDNSSNNFTLTVNGNTSVQRFSPFNPTAPYSASTIGGSGYFDGSGDYITTPSISAIGTSNFSHECWFYSTANSGDTLLNDAGAGVGTFMFVNFSSGLIYGGINGSAVVGGSYTLKPSQWYHFVFCRSGSTVSIFLNGVRVFTASSSASSGAGAYNIGAAKDATRYLTGYICDTRFVDGTSVYDATASTITVPTAPLTPITNTSLLCNFTNAGIPDSAMMNDLETVGNAQVSTSVKKYGTGSLAFDGTGDWLQLPITPQLYLGTTYTIEAWIYPSTVSDWQPVFSMTEAFTGGFTELGIYRNGTSIRAALRTTTNGAVTFIEAGTVSTNTWYHVALSVNATSAKLFLNGTQIGSTTTFAEYPIAKTTYAAVGNWGNGFSTTGYSPWNGYIDDLRITKGLARYTTTFTPPTAALPTY